MTVHELKTWPDYFEAVTRGAKTFEVRVNDRDFELGDFLVLREWDPHDCDHPGGGPGYTGRVAQVRVNYLCDIPNTENLVGMSITRTWVL